jgi:hypothetical protein
MSTSADTIVVDLLASEDTETEIDGNLDLNQETDSQDTSNRIGRKNHHRWNPSRYISLLHSVLLYSPFSIPYKTKGATWNHIAENYNMAIETPNAINGRKAKEKFEFLLSAFRKEEVESLRKSGTDEEYTEMNHLLEELDELEHDAKVENETMKESNKKQVICSECNIILNKVVEINFIYID